MSRIIESDGKEKKVEYIELIYDLIFVYIIGRNNSLLHHFHNGFVEPAMFLAYILCTLAVIQIWTFTAYYINLYGRSSIRDHVFMFVNMFLLYFIGEGTRQNWQGYHTQYHAAWALILVNVGLQYIIEYRRHIGQPEHLRRTRRMAAILMTEAAIVALSVPFYNVTGSTLLTPVAILFGISATLIAGRRSCSGLVDFQHLSERAMLYVVFTFGEMIIAMASYFEGELNAGSLYFSLMGFLIVVGLFLSYGYFYDNIVDREKKTNGLGYMLTHIFIIFALNNITSSLEFMRNEEILLMPKMLMLTGSFVFYYAFLFSLTAYAKRKCAFSRRLYPIMAAAGAGFVAVMLAFRRMMVVNIALSVVFVFGVFAVLRIVDKRANDTK